MNRIKIVQAVFAAALERSGPRRAAYLRERCAGDPDMRREVESLLRHSEAAEGFMERPAVLDAVADQPAGPRASQTLPTCIGPYRILGVLGKGGMGVVYRARQIASQRIVALKVIRPELTSRPMLERFARETCLHIRLAHPGIARVYEVGTTPGPDRPRPFLAMEYVDGLPLTTFAQRHRLSWPRRLALLARVCAAVQHAHTLGIVHRDLKPANILVATTGEPKLLDFGVARLLGSDTSLTATRGGLARLIGTLPYMSPEQAAGCSQPDARCDVYALGVIGFELLADRLPLNPAGRSLPELLEMVCRHDPLPVRAYNSAVSPQAQAVIAKALAKTPAHRYASAAQYADNLLRVSRNHAATLREPHQA